jgi:hypothetical protein
VAEWAIMNWVRDNNTRSKIWAILPVETRAVLPRIDESGYWEDFRRFEDERFTEYEDAREAIDQDGFYFVRERVAIGPLKKPV